MPFSTRQIGPCFAAEVEGLDLREPPSPQDAAAIHAGMHAYAVLVFHDQPLTDEQHLAFSRGLGELEDASGAGTSVRLPDADDFRLPTTFADVSNLDRDRQVQALDGRPGHVGQPSHDAPWPALSGGRAARRAPYEAYGRGANRGAGRLNSPR